jgi:PleD family two-component response regulator
MSIEKNNMKKIVSFIALNNKDKRILIVSDEKDGLPALVSYLSDNDIKSTIIKESEEKTSDNVSILFDGIDSAYSKDNSIDYIMF